MPPKTIGTQEAIWQKNGWQKNSVQRIESTIFLPAIFLPFKINCVLRSTLPCCIESFPSPAVKIFGRKKHKKMQKGQRSLMAAQPKREVRQQVSDSQSTRMLNDDTGKSTSRSSNHLQRPRTYTAII